MPYYLIYDNNEVLNMIEVTQGALSTIYPYYTGTLEQCWDQTDVLGLTIPSGINLPVRPPKPAVPYEVTRRQLFLAVYNYNTGLTRAALRSSINSEAGLIEFDEALSFKRDHPLVLSLGTQLGLTSGQIDQLFIAASGI